MYLFFIILSNGIIDCVRDGLFFEVHNLRLSLKLHHDLLQLRQLQSVVHVLQSFCDTYKVTGFNMLSVSQYAHILFQGLFCGLKGVGEREECQGKFSVVGTLLCRSIL